MNHTNYRGLVEKAAAAHALDPDLVEAVVLMESSGNADAFRFEPVFWQHYMRSLPEYAQSVPRRVSSSYGLMQVMYVVAVQYGFVGEPEELFLPQNSLEYGCRKMAADLKWANGDIVKTLAAYNAGRGGVGTTAGLTYAQKVLQIKNT